MTDKEKLAFKELMTTLEKRASANEESGRHISGKQIVELGHEIAEFIRNNLQEV